MPRDTLLETRESVVTARLVGLGLTATAAMVVAIAGGSSALAAGKETSCTCAPARAAPVAARAAQRQAHSQAYAERFYNYWKASPVSMTGWHGEWRQAPDDWIVPAAYAGGYDEGAYDEGATYGPPPGYGEQPGLSIDRGGWSGGVGGFAAGGGGGGGFGQAIIAQGGGGLNGPTYNDYNQSFQYNPSRAGPWLNRVPSSGGGSGGGK
jgi:hypothetical protein